jgi:hypothetical protein
MFPMGKIKVKKGRWMKMKEYVGKNLSELGFIVEILQT